MYLISVSSLDASENLTDGINISNGHLGELIQKSGSFKFEGKVKQYGC